MFRALASLSVVFVLLAVACGGDDDAGSDTPSPSTTVAASPSPDCTTGAVVDGTVSGEIEAGGGPRAYALHLPASYDATTRVPLVVAFHGTGTSGPPFLEYTKLVEAASDAGYAVVAPDAAGLPTRWDTSATSDDVDLIGDLIDQIEDEYCVDGARVYAAGFSNGGGMAQRLACAKPEEIAAIAVVAATYAPCQAGVPMIAFHGVDDAAVPFEGGPAPDGAGEFPLVRRAVSEWARAVGCDGLPAISRDSSNVERATYPRCSGGDGQVLLFTILGGGHTWPGAVPLPIDVAGVTTNEIDASETILAFFDEQP